MRALVLSILLVGCGERIVLQERTDGAVADPGTGRRTLHVSSAPASPRATFVMGADDLWFCDGDVVRIPKSGGVTEVVASDDCGYGITLHEGRPVWISGGYPAAGGAIRTLDGGGVVRTLVDSAPRAASVAIYKSEVYWLEDPDGLTTVRARELAGGAPRVVHQRAEERARHLHATTDGVFFLLTTVGKANLQHTAYENPYVPAGSVGKQRGVVTDAEHVYFVTDDHLVSVTTNNDGGTYELVDLGYLVNHAPSSYAERGLCLSSSRVFATSNAEDGTSSVYSVDLAGTNPRILAKSSAHTLDCAVAGDRLYTLELPTTGPARVVEHKL